MATFSENIAKIATSRYGRDVRTAIVDALTQSESWVGGTQLNTGFSVQVLKYDKKVLSNDDGHFHNWSNGVGYVTDFIQTSPSEKFVVCGGDYNLAANAFFYDVSGKYLYASAIRNKDNIPPSTQAIMQPYVITIPDNCYKVRFQSVAYETDANTDYPYLFVYKLYPICSEQDGLHFVHEYADIPYFDLKNCYVKSLNSANYPMVLYVDQQKVYSTLISPLFKYDSNYTVEYRGNGGQAAVAAVAFDSNFKPVKSFTQMISPDGYTKLSLPSGTKYIQFYSVYSRTDDSLIQHKRVLSVRSYLTGSVQNVTDKMNPLFGKTYQCFGDSYTIGYHDSLGSEKYPYANRIASAYGMNVHNYAVPGRTLTTNNQGNGLTIEKEYKNIKDGDYCTFMFGLNDIKKGATVGTKDSTDNKTYWGAWNEVFSWIMNNAPSAHVGMIIPNGWFTEDLEKLFIEIATYWGIPYLDLKGDPNIPMLAGGRYTDTNTLAVSKRNSVFYGSNEHPTKAFYDYITPIIAEFMKGI